MTQREFFTKVIEANISEELTSKAQELVAGLDKRTVRFSRVCSPDEMADDLFEHLND